MNPTRTTNWTSATPEKSEAWGRRFAGVLRLGDLLRLHGELGAGKTTFCRGLGVGLGLSEPMTSPTYLLCKEYAWRDGAVLHLDGYFAQRLGSLLGEGLLERFDGQHLILVEWADHVRDWLPREGLDLHIQASVDCLGGEDDAERRFELQARGERAEATLQAWEDILRNAEKSAEPRPQTPR